MFVTISNTYYEAMSINGSLCHQRKYFWQDRSQLGEINDTIASHVILQSSYKVCNLNNIF